MTMLQYVLQGLALGAIYGLIALPISLVWRATGMLDLGIGGYAVVAGMSAATAASLGMGLLAGMLLGTLGGAIAAGTLIALRARGQSDPIAGVVATAGILFAAESYAQWTFGAVPVFRRVWDAGLEVGGLSIRPEMIVNVSVAILLLVATLWTLNRTSLGRMLRAVAANADDAALVGIPVRRMQFGVILFSAVLASLAGILIVMTVGMEPTSGIAFTIFAVGAVIVFGMRGPLSALGGGLVLGLVSAFAAGYAPSTVGPIVPMLFVFVVLASGVFDFDHEDQRA